MVELKQNASCSCNAVYCLIPSILQRKNQWIWDEEHALLMHDPIYR